MHFAAIVFWVAILVIWYNYIGYGILIGALAGLKRGRTSPEEGFQPPVTLVIAAYNEQEVLPGKIDNCLALDYPSELLTILFVTDGSTDSSPQLVRANPRLKLMHQTGRLGKSAAINRAMATLTTPIVIFSDANTLLNPAAIQKIVRHYADPATGGVAGEKKVLESLAGGTAGMGEGLYWKYESLLKKWDAAFYTVVGAAGELFSVRRALYEPVEPRVILDDFVISLRIAARGYRIAYEPGAYALEAPSASMAEERKRKVRICAGGFQAIGLLKSLLLFWRRPALSFQYVSHRVLRWTLTPLCLPLVFGANLALVALGAGYFYDIVLAFQILFYLSGMAGWYGAGKKGGSKLLQVPYYFLFMNFSVYLGFFRFLNHRQSAVWEKAVRQSWLPGHPDLNGQHGTAS